MEGGIAADADIRIDWYWGGAWHQVYSGTVAQLTWVEIVCPSGTHTISRARIRYNNSGAGNVLYLNEFYFCEI